MTGNTDGGNDGRTAAEDYRQQRQASEGDRNNFSAISPAEFMRWLEGNRPRLAELARSNGVAETEIDAVVASYMEMLKSLPPGGPYDDLNVTLILAGVIQRVEAACTSGNIPVRDGVVFGVTPMLGLDASQLAVMGTGASIIAVTQAFPAFCNSISKAVALTMVPDDKAASWAPDAVRARLGELPEIAHRWATILASYAAYGAPERATPLAFDIAMTATRLLILRSMELFAVAHEYGHHVLEHGLAESSDAVRDDFRDEHEADIFGRMVCMAEGMTAEPVNLVAASGSGAVIMLTALDMVRRTRALLENGDPVPPPRGSHPPLDDRLDVIAEADVHASEPHRIVFAEMRRCARDLMEAAWEHCLPLLEQERKQGLRPERTSADAGGWLPGR